MSLFISRIQYNTNYNNKTPEAGVAWLSSARVVRRLVNSLNERNPCLQTS